MLLFKFKAPLTLLFFTLSLWQTQALAQTKTLKFSLKECLETNFTADVTHKGQPFGLTDTILNIEKEGCVLKIHHHSLKFLKKAWEIDVCRAPVHIKSGAGAVSVLRREGPCLEGATSEFCQETKSIDAILQNDGLIFAQGEREDLTSPHGQIHCAYTMLNHYLYDGKILSRHEPMEERSNSWDTVKESEQREINEEFPESAEPGKF